MTLWRAHTHTQSVHILRRKDTRHGKVGGRRKHTVPSPMMNLCSACRRHPFCWNVRVCAYWLLAHEVAPPWLLSARGITKHMRMRTGCEIRLCEVKCHATRTLRCRAGVHKFHLQPSRMECEKFNAVHVTNELKGERERNIVRSGCKYIIHCEKIRSCCTRKS